MKKKILVLVDFQHDFVARGGVLSFDNGAGDSALIIRMNKFLGQLQKGDFDKVIVTYDTHKKGIYEFTKEAKTFPIHCVEGTKGHKLSVQEKVIDTLADDVFRLNKDTYDMFADNVNTDKLPEWFLKGVPDIYIAGVASDICNRAAMEGFLAKGHKVNLIEDLTRGIFKETKEVVAEEKYKKYLKNNQLNLVQSTEVLQDFTIKKNTAVKKNFRGENR